MHHHHDHEVNGRNLFLTVLLNIVITLSQVVGGVLSGSLALLSDAVHNFSDVLALLIAYGANRLAGRPDMPESTFGYRRAEILAALFNALVLIGVAIFLLVESVRKLIHPEPVDSIWVIGLGLLSIVLNAASVMLIAKDARESMNVKAVYLHLLTDVMTSVAVLGGGILIYFWGIDWIDPLISAGIALYLFTASYDLVRESARILMQFAPEGIDLESVAASITQEPLVVNVHHIHLWQLDEHRIHLEAHLDFAEDLPLSRVTELIESLEKRLEERFGITHSTFQCEYGRKDDKRLVV